MTSALVSRTVVSRGDDSVSGSRRAAYGRRARSRRWRIGSGIGRQTYLTISICSFVVIFVVWATITNLGLVPPMFLPSPQAVLGELVGQGANGELWTDIAASVYRIAAGYLLASVMAVPIGLLIGAFMPIEAAMQPVLDFVRYMPVVAFVPLTILWVGTGDLQKFTIIWMGTFFQQVLMIATEVQRVDHDLLRLGRTLGMSEWKILKRVVIPAAAPGIWDTLRVTLGWAWTWLVVAELVAATTGLGYRITLSQRYFATDTMIAYVLVLGVLGLVGDQAMRWLKRKLFSYATDK